MRVPPLPPADLPTGSRALHGDMAAVIAGHLKGFVSQRADGALIGPFAPMLRFPQFGGPAWDYTKAMIEHATLPKPVREVAILATAPTSTRVTSSMRTSTWPKAPGCRRQRYRR